MTHAISAAFFWGSSVRSAQRRASEDSRKEASINTKYPTVAEPATAEDLHPGGLPPETRAYAPIGPRGDQGSPVWVMRHTPYAPKIRRQLGAGGPGALWPVFRPELAGPVR